MSMIVTIGKRKKDEEKVVIKIKGMPKSDLVKIAEEIKASYRR